MYVHWQLISFDAQCGQTFYQYTIAISNSKDFTRYVFEAYATSKGFRQQERQLDEKII